MECVQQQGQQVFDVRIFEDGEYTWLHASSVCRVVSASLNKGSQSNARTSGQRQATREHVCAGCDEGTFVYAAASGKDRDNAVSIAGDNHFPATNSCVRASSVWLLPTCTRQLPGSGYTCHGATRNDESSWATLVRCDTCTCTWGQLSGRRVPIRALYTLELAGPVPGPPGKSRML